MKGASDRVKQKAGNKGDAMLRTPNIWIEDKKDLRLFAELPGCDEKTISFSVEPESVVIEGSNDRVHFKGRRGLPSNVQPDKTTASYENGILTLKFKRKGGRKKKAKPEPEQEQESCETIDKEIFDNLKEQLDKRTAEYDSLRNKFERFRNDFESFRARTGKDKEDFGNRKVEEVVNNFLLVADNIENALRTTDVKNCDPEKIYRGLEILSSMFGDALKKAGIEEIDPLDKPFDPDFHEAVGELQNKKKKEHTVVFVQQKGYIYNGRVLRPARVIVSKK
jgi:molecular chaperone GrpE